MTGRSPRSCCGASRRRSRRSTSWFRSTCWATAPTSARGCARPRPPRPRRRRRRGAAGCSAACRGARSPSACAPAPPLPPARRLSDPSRVVGRRRPGRPADLAGPAGADTAPPWQCTPAPGQRPHLFAPRRPRPAPPPPRPRAPARAASRAACHMRPPARAPRARAARAGRPQPRARAALRIPSPSPTLMSPPLTYPTCPPGCLLRIPAHRSEPPPRRTPNARPPPRATRPPALGPGSDKRRPQRAAAAAACGLLRPPRGAPLRPPVPPAADRASPPRRQRPRLPQAPICPPPRAFDLGRRRAARRPRPRPRGRRASPRPPRGRGPPAARCPRWGEGAPGCGPPLSPRVLGTAHAPPHGAPNNTCQTTRRARRGPARHNARRSRQGVAGARARWRTRHCWTPLRPARRAPAARPPGAARSAIPPQPRS
jgi:hypothetical protein